MSLYLIDDTGLLATLLMGVATGFAAGAWIVHLIYCLRFTKELTD